MLTNNILFDIMTKIWVSDPKKRYFVLKFNKYIYIDFSSPCKKTLMKNTRAI